MSLLLCLFEVGTSFITSRLAGSREILDNIIHKNISSRNEKRPALIFL